jgi:arylmalonate decarboxylase
MMGLFDEEERIAQSPLLHVLRSYDPYGWLAKIGLVTPSTNTVTGPEWHLMAPKGVAIHVARATLYGATSQSSYEAMARSAEEAAADLATAEVDIVSFCCTSGTFVCDRAEIARKMAEKAGVPANTASEAVVAALRALGARRVALSTPYLDFVNEAEVRMLTEEGFEVVAAHGLGLGHTQAERRAMNRIPHEVVFKMAQRVDRPDADAIFLSCAALPAIHLIEEMEAYFGKPVITTNQATFWHTLRMLNVRNLVAGFGSLFRQN